MPPSTTLPVAGSWATCPLKKRKPSILTAWENGPAGGASSGEVTAVLLTGSISVRRLRQRRRREHAVQAHVVRDLAVVIDQIECMGEYQVPPNRFPLSAGVGKGNRFGECGVGNLFDRLLAECKRCFEPRHELGLWPSGLDGVRRRRVLRIGRRFHGAEGAAVEVAITH